MNDLYSEKAVDNSL